MGPSADVVNLPRRRSTGTVIHDSRPADLLVAMGMSRTTLNHPGIVRSDFRA